MIHLQFLLPFYYGLRLNFQLPPIIILGKVLRYRTIHKVSAKSIFQNLLSVITKTNFNIAESKTMTKTIKVA